MLLAVGLLLSTLVSRLDGRFLEVSKPPPGTVAIVPTEDDGESVLNGPLFQDLQELDREKASEMISVKLFNQYHARTFDVADQPDESGREFVEDRPMPEDRGDYDTVNRLDGNGNDLEIAYAHPPPIVPIDVIELKENGIEQDLILPEPMPDERLLNAWAKPDSRQSRLPESIKPNSMTTTTTTTTTRTTTVRKIRRKIRRQSVSTTSSHPLTTSTTTSTTRRSTRLATPYRSTTARTTTSQRPPRPKLDITKLNLDHLEDDLLLSYTTLAPSPQALPLAGSNPSARLLPRSIRQEETGPSTCGCQHKKRSLGNHLYSSEEAVDPAGDYDDYDDYDYDELRLPRAPVRPLLFPALSGLLAPPGSGEHPESSVERAEKVHGTLERLMGIVTIFSHVDEFIQRKTKQSIRRLAKLYESEEQY